jgi:hypothetical protein
VLFRYAIFRVKPFTSCSQTEGPRLFFESNLSQAAPRPRGLGYFSSQTFHIHTAVSLHTISPMKMEETQCSETLAFKLQMPGNNQEESIRQDSYCYWYICELTVKSRYFIHVANRAICRPCQKCKNRWWTRITWERTDCRMGYIAILRDSHQSACDLQH